MIHTAKDAFTRPNNATQYAVGDVMAAGTAAMLQFSTFASNPVTIKGAMCIDSAAQATKPSIDLLLFEADQTDLDADNAAYTPTDAQMLTCVGYISFATGSFVAGDATAGANGNSVCQVTGLNLSVAPGGGHLIYAVPVARNTYTPVANEVFTFKLLIEH